MKTIIIPGRELFDSKKNVFVMLPETRIDIEHNLISVSKWEMKWNKPFLAETQKTNEEVIDYVRCMTINEGVPDEAYGGLTTQNVKEIEEYLSLPMTATTINRHGQKPGRKRVVTSELIYCWMIQLGIPKEFEVWPLQRLMVLIEVCGIESGPQKKMSKKDTLSQYRALNAARRAKTGSKG